MVHVKCVVGPLTACPVCLRDGSFLSVELSPFVFLHLFIMSHYLCFDHQSPLPISILGTPPYFDSGVTILHPERITTPSCVVRLPRRSRFRGPVEITRLLLLGRPELGSLTIPFTPYSGLLVVPGHDTDYMMSFKKESMCNFVYEWTIFFCVSRGLVERRVVTKTRLTPSENLPSKGRRKGLKRSGLTFRTRTL